MNGKNKVLLVLVLLILTSDVVRAQFETSYWIVEKIKNFVYENGKTIINFSYSPYIGFAMVLGVSVQWLNTISLDINGLSSWIDRITGLLDRNELSTHEDSCWCLEYPPPPIEKNSISVGIYVRMYGSTLSTLCKNQRLKIKSCGGDDDDCKDSRNLVKTLCP